MDTHDCCFRMHGSGFTFRGSLCSKKAKVERDGKWFCGTHDPIKIAERRSKRDAKWAEQSKRDNARRQLQCAASDLLAAAKMALACAQSLDQDMTDAYAALKNAVAKAEGDVR